ncbi:PadR family transcriptional regulator [Klebsiella michiganensis]|uniref:PadR family transcriptional regulator n=1 Tax=Klebsiella michiganensis TaxID=1134687 RepID=UPI0019202868|nr:PadR family transcriptional regulator [Klebsiella michiganensis]MBL0788932.1 PadR family transcriptional regulator [Klebsiella michiganensis]
MRVLTYAILGLLNRTAMTGYDISKAFNHELAKFWHAKHSQIYGELKSMYNDGLVTYDIEISGDILEKKKYSITDSGRDELLRWLHKDEPIEKTAKDVFRVRMYFSHYLDLATRIHLLENQRIQHFERLNILQKTMEQYPQVPPLESDRFGDFIVLEGAICRQESVLRWIDKCIGYCRSGK